MHNLRNCSKILSQGIIVLASNLYAFGDESMSNKLYFMDNMENEKINAKLLYVTKSKYGDDWHSSIHSHHFTEFFFIAKGSGTFIVMPVLVALILERQRSVCRKPASRCSGLKKATSHLSEVHISLPRSQKSNAYCSKT